MSNSWKFFDKQSDKVERVLKKYSLNSHGWRYISKLV